jgi:peptidoglycan/LPS O-acetylase OafA/YrhL
MFSIYVIWHDWANYHEATFTDRKEAAAYIRRVRRLAPRHLTRLTVVHS